MQQKLSSLLDLRLALRRVTTDINKGKYFLDYPFELELVKVDEDKYLADLGDALDKEAYYPLSLVTCDVPKKNFTIRAGNYISISDRVIYTACIGYLLPDIFAKLKWSQGIVEFANQLHGYLSSDYLFKNAFKSWSTFREQSEARISSGVTYVVFSDIANFYDNIDIATLMSCVRELSGDQKVVNLLSKILNRWAHSCGNRGIPQGQSPSHVLAKLYLDSIDFQMKALGYDYIRYNDDVRIFCRTHTEAKKAILDLTSFLRAKSLSIQSAKTQILTSADALQAISGVQPTILQVRDRYIASLRANLAQGSLSDEIEDDGHSTSIGDDLREMPIEVIKQAFDSHFIRTNNTDFDKTLFHYLINRLKKSGDGFAIQHCIPMLSTHPEETREILEYFASVEGAYNLVEVHLNNIIKPGGTIYPYQIYEILSWLGKHEYVPSANTLQEIRRLTYGTSHPAYVRSWARYILSIHGTSSDFEQIERSYNQENSSQQRSEIICCLKKMEAGRRNNFISRAQYDGELERRATIIAKQK